MKFRYVLSFTAFAVIVVSCVYYIAALGVRIGPPDKRVNVTMQVPDINGLVVDSNVLLRGVQVGKVTGIHTTLDVATVSFYIDQDYPVPVNSEVRLENLSALGESYIGLLPRTSTGPMFYDGQQVATEDVRQPASISELATSVTRVLNQMDPAALSRLVGELDGALPSDKMVLPNLERASMLLRNTVMGMNGAGGRVLENMQTLLENAGFVGPRLAEIAPSLYALGPPIHWLHRYAQDLVTETGSPEGIRNVGRLMNRVQGFLDDRAPDLKVFAEAFTPNIKAVAAAAMNVDTGQILSNMLNAIPEDGTITLRVKTPPP
ncbi:MlaD family protein [Mycobacterium sp. AT1]|uniref:MlaD family protein n=1 Tax=Mycobacterium sp. AT1 TaxID=1961706 RepID=UPI0009AC1344|nr:MlaD family protein [Mycobacterium sp. AT1]OPX11960.1 mammalian cell entry protein [Mycobacterium sp. AT1]